MVTYRDLRYDNGAKPAFKVERWVKQIVRSRTVIVHGGTHDRTAFTIEPNVFVNSRVIDTQRLYRHLQPEDGTPSLKTAAWEILSVDIQADDRHSAVEDAQTAMKLWSHHQKPGRRGDDSDTITSKGDEQRDVIDSRHWRIDDDQVEWDRRNGRRLYYTPGGALLDV
jgi:RNA exonuclease 4